jgi:hypothetical protein
MKGSSGEVFNEMCRYKAKGEPLHLEVIKLVPVSERLPALSKIYGIEKISAVLSIAITKALNSFNLSYQSLDMERFMIEWICLRFTSY